MIQLFRTYHSDDSGSVIVEAALVLPLLILAGLGCLDASNMMLQNHKLESQLSMAASFLSRSDNPSNLETSAKKLALTGSIDGSSDAVLKGWALSDIIITYTATDNQPNEDGVSLYRGGDTVDTVVITSQVNYQGFGILSSIMSNNATLNSTVEERVIGGGL